MKKILRIFVLSYLFCSSILGAYAQKPQIGKWRDHLAHSVVNAIAVTDTRVYAGGAGLFYYDREDGSLHRMTKIQGFSDFNVTNLAYYKKKDALVITYENSNIDLYINDVIYNISDLKRSDMYTVKGINHVSFDGNYAYLSCDFGIVVLDLDKKEIYNTYIIGPNATTVKVNAIDFNDNSIFAATNNGLFYANKNDPWLINYNRWTHLNNIIEDTLVSDTITDVKYYSGKLLLSLEKRKRYEKQKNDTDEDSSKTVEYSEILDTSFFYYSHNLTDWERFHEDAFISSQVLNGDYILINKNAVKSFDNNLLLKNSLVSIDPCWIDLRCGVVAEDNTFWMSQGWDNLSYIEDYRKGIPCYHKIQEPTGPGIQWAYKLSVSEDKMLMVPGGRTPKMAPLYHEANLYTYSNNSWSPLKGNSLLTPLGDFIDVAVDPFGKDNYYIASILYGIAEVSNNEIVKVYNDTNSDGALLRLVQEDYNVLQIAAVEFDAEGNLWALNSFQDRGLVVRHKDGSWKNFYTGSLYSNPFFTDLIISKYTNYKWFFGLDGKIYVHDGESKSGFIDPNHGNDFPSSAVKCLLEDQNGVMYIGTNNGVRVIYNTGDLFSYLESNRQINVASSIIIPKVEEGNEPRPLLESVTVNCMAIDGANRKWIGTESAGVFLMSENMDEQLLSFTAENSPLFSNNILNITINPLSGEIFFITDKGIVSYMGEAIESKERYSDVYVYPNPIRPDYDGPIAIKGLVENSLIHITDMAGNVVFTTNALGGQAIWNGRSLSGNRVATGVYLVFAADNEGDQRVVTKLLFIK